MPLIQRKAKINDFLVASNSSYHKPNVHTSVTVPLCTAIGSKGTYLTAMPRHKAAVDMIYVYHYEKRRAKVTCTPMVSGRGKNMKHFIERTVVRKAEWKLRVFAFPADRVKSVVQHARHFTLVMQ